MKGSGHNNRGSPLGRFIHVIFAKTKRIWIIHDAARDRDTQTCSPLCILVATFAFRFLPDIP